VTVQTGDAKLFVRRYVVHSNNIQKVGEVPTVRLNYDILPIVVQFSEKKQAFYHFITNVSGRGRLRSDDHHLGSQALLTIVDSVPPCLDYHQ
jgi:hypothetical protein